MRDASTSRNRFSPNFLKLKMQLKTFTLISILQLISGQVAQELPDQVAYSSEPEQLFDDGAQVAYSSDNVEEFVDVFTDPETGLYYEYNDQDDTFYQVQPSELEFYPNDQEVSESLFDN